MIKKVLFLTAVIFGLSGYSQTVVFSEGFNDVNAFNAWTLGDLDGDGELWEFADADFEEVESFQGGFIWSWSWYLQVFTPDNTITSPVITLPAEGDLALRFKVGVFDDDEEFQENYAVYVIPANSTFTGTEEPVFEERLDAPYYNPAKEVTVDISPSLAGQDVQLVFRHYDCTNIFYIGLDDIEIIQTTLGRTDLEKTTVRVYPNPTTDVVTVEGLEGVNSIRVFDLKGQKVKDVNAAEVSMKSLQSGTYIVNFYTDTKVFSKKVIKK